MSVCGTCVVGHWRPCRAAAMMFVAVAHLRMSKYMTLGLSLRDRRTWASNHCKHTDVWLLENNRRRSSLVLSDPAEHSRGVSGIQHVSRVSVQPGCRNQTMSHQIHTSAMFTSRRDTYYALSTENRTWEIKLELNNDTVVFCGACIIAEM